ncbi:Pentatricopeptide repeat, partial [Dillenia turbinata]
GLDCSVSVVKVLIDVEDLVLGMAVHCGEVEISRSLFDKREIEHVLLWNAMISGYAKSGFAEEAIELFLNMKYMNLKPDSVTVGSAILASAHMGELARWMDGYIINSYGRVKKNGLQKDLGYSLIEINGMHQEAGYAPDTESILHDLNYEDKEHALCNHSERLATAYGLIVTPLGPLLE